MSKREIEERARVRSQEDRVHGRMRSAGVEMIYVRAGSGFSVRVVKVQKFAFFVEMVHSLIARKGVPGGR